MIKFTKMHGLGNDYIYIDCIKGEKIENPSYLAKTMSNRHFGIGSDGLILICKSNIADFKMQMFNYDGSEAEMCGNGIRCVGKYVYDNKLTNNKIITVETLGGIKKLKLNIKNKKVETVEVDMGEPIFEAEKIPVLSDKYPVKNLKIIAEDKEFIFTCVSMGNPHAVTIIKNVIGFDVQRYGEILEKSKIFPQRANIEFVQILDKENVKMRVWERGTGETLACGTGACATVIACNLNGYVKNDVNVELPGGILKIKWNKENNHVYMTGPAITVFRGEIVKPLGN
jgi:diaminopimelate epimerase